MERYLQTVPALQSTEHMLLNCGALDFRKIEYLLKVSNQMKTLIRLPSWGQDTGTREVHGSSSGSSI